MCRSEFTIGEGTDGRATAGGGSTTAGDPLASSSPPPPAGTQRFFFALDAVSNPAIAATPCSKFFHACWQVGALLLYQGVVPPVLYDLRYWSNASPWVASTTRPDQCIAGSKHLPHTHLLRPCLILDCSSYVPVLAYIQEGLHYDVDNRVGVIFNLSDKYMTGTLGILAVGMAPHEMYGSMQVGVEGWPQGWCVVLCR
jgi:hypothetical protein